MGHTLAALHRAMAALPPYDLPDLAAFPGVDVSGRPRQLLHGDFSWKNVRGWRVFDFDDCGYGPVELDLANSLYFVLFGALTREDPTQYERFRRAFLDGYGDRPGDDVLDGLITRRVRTLRAWLDDPATAPPGVRNASAAWRATLAGFVERHLGP
jgi:Ser/Thr protein kinase RdoA (MazF antagonist)